MKRYHIIIIAAAVLLLFLGVTAALGYLYQHERERTDALKEQLHELRETAKRAVIERSVSGQMEEIAYEQKAMSDEQREAANEQARIASEMRAQSELERQRAVDAREDAEVSMKLAVMASAEAEEQQKLAEQREEQAEEARRLADTLGFQSLARSLGSSAVMQWNLNNKELASELAYASYYFADRYHADTYQPAIYEALMLASSSSRQWGIGRGIIVKMERNKLDKKRILTVSTYGEILSHYIGGDNLHTEVLLRDNRYDFRDLFQDDNGAIYAVSRTGTLVVKDGLSLKDYPIARAVHPFRIFSWDNDHLLIVAEKSLHLFNISSRQFEKEIPLNFQVQIVGRKSNELRLFGKGSTVVRVAKPSLALSTMQLPFKGQVWSYTASDNEGEEAYGMTDGVIYLIDSKGRQRKLVGHRSRVSRVDYDGSLLYSVSYDGTANVWDTKKENVDPVRLLTTNRWVVSLFVDGSMNNIWTGDQRGKLTRTIINVPRMASLVKASLKRNMTREEWNQYVGKNIPYVKFK